MDIISNLLSLIHIGGSVVAEIQCHGEWGLDMEQGEGIPFHYMMNGSCHLSVGSTEKIVNEGDLILFPKWHNHVLKSSLGAKTQTISETIVSRDLPLWASGTLDQPLVFTVGEGKKNLKFLSGVFKLEGRGSEILLDQMPDVIQLDVNATQLTQPIQSVVVFISQECQSNRQGYSSVASRLMDLLFIQILRGIMLQPEIPPSPLAGIADKQLFPALAAIHGKPELAWTVESLAKEVGLSRTLFAERFKERVGVTPVRYLTNIRMCIAERLLIDTNTSINSILIKTGYKSYFAFARAFQNFSDHTPRNYRKIHRQHGTSQNNIT